MSETVTFHNTFRYNLQTSGIILPVRLAFAGLFVDFKASIDTGASYCIFWRGYGEQLGLDIEQGMPETISTAMGSFQVYGHSLLLSTIGLSFETTVYFAAHPQFSRNVLGRQGWLDRVKLGLVDYEGKLLLSPYDE